MISANQLQSNDPSISESERTVLITMKGELDIIIQRCSSYKTNKDEILPFNTEMKKTVFDRQEELGKNGYHVIAMCQQRFTRQEYDEMLEQYAEDKRLRPLADEDLDGFPSDDYCFVGLFALIDQPLEEVPDAVTKAQRAQIRVAIVTGDDPITAKAVAKQINILTPEISEMNSTDTLQTGHDANGQTILNLYRNNELLKQHVASQVMRLDSENQNSTNVMKQIQIDAEPDQGLPWYKQAWASCRSQFSEPTSDLPKTSKMEYIPYAIVATGAEISLMDDFMWDWVLPHQQLVFAQISPEQKFRIVMELQRRGETVAVVGDSTGDAPVLKCANLGVAMQSSTEVAKEAGNIVILDNSFSSIIQAVETGRLLSDNLKKVTIYLLPGGSWSQIWPVFFNLWFGMPLALSAFWCTIFCMLNDVFMSLAMVTEKSERDIMTRPPANREKDHLINLKLLNHAYFFVGNFECFHCILLLLLLLD